MMNNKVRVRFAPSPTGYLHVGGLRTALYNYLFAKKHGGTFILRIEDTDQKRYVEGAVEKLRDTLKGMGLNWDEGPFIQSERLEKYKKYAEQLVRVGKAYRCFCTPQRLEEVKQAKIAAKLAAMYDGHCANISPEEAEKRVAAGEKHVIRLKVNKDKNIEFNDLVRDKVKFNADIIDDQVLIKSDDFPTYHLASVVDDHEMEITHVIRGEEWLSSTPKHILLYEAFGWPSPEFAHLPLLLNPDRSKLSKRQGDVAVEDYLSKGYLKEALLNFVALLGWNPGKGSTQEIFSLDELIRAFDLSGVNKSGAVFDLRKLDWLNAQYIKKLSVDELYSSALPFLQSKEFYQQASAEKKSEEYIKKVLIIEQERLTNLASVGESNGFFFRDVSPAKELLRWKGMDDEALRKSLETSQSVLEKINEGNWTRENLEKELLAAAGEKRGDLLWPLRAALSGDEKSPSPFELAWVLGKKESLKRLERPLSAL